MREKETAGLLGVNERGREGEIDSIYILKQHEILLLKQGGREERERLGEGQKCGRKSDCRGGGQREKEGGRE